MQMEAEQHQERTWMHGAAMLTIWWPVLAFVCLSIYSRIQSKYLDGLLVSSGIASSPTVSDFLFLYRQDLIIFGVVLPLLTVWAFAKLRFAIAAIVSIVLVLLLQVLLYANLQTWGQVGSFLTWQALENGISFGLSNPEYVGEYISIDGMLKLVGLIAFSVGVLVVGHIVWRKGWLIRIWGIAGLASVTLCAILSSIGYTSSMRAAPISGSFVLNALAALKDDDPDSVAAPPINQLDERYAQLARISQSEYQGPNFGVQKGSNLLIFVLETASIEFLDTRKGLPDHPVLNKLKDNLLVAKNHYTTFPASAEGNLSLLTGAYPPRAIYGTCLIDIPRTGGMLPGPIAQLREANYKTSLYAPYQSQVPADKTVFESSGFEKIIYGDSLSGPGNADERAVKRLTSDIADWSRNNQPFAVALLPQIGHGPWPNSLGATIQERGEKLARIQLDWLGNIVETLRAVGQLDNTVIVLTGDHGVRTSAEDKRVKVGMIDWYSFHVPLLLYAPRADYSNVDSFMPSSHVDIPSELSELFGLTRLPSYQGLAFHNPERSKRRGFLMAGWYFGANGYRDSDQSAMYSDLLGAVYARSDGKVDFSTKQIVAEDKRRAVIQDQLSAMASLQEVWITDRLCGDKAS